MYETRSNTKFYYLLLLLLLLLLFNFVICNVQCNRLSFVIPYYKFEIINTITPISLEYQFQAAIAYNLRLILNIN